MEDLKPVYSEKCPLCGGDVLLGECSSCGYALPDTESLSALYDLDPDNVTFGEAAKAGDDDDIPSIGVPDISALPTLSRHRQAVRQKKQEEKEDAENAANAANKPFVPYTKPNYNTPEAPGSDIPVRVVKAVSDFVVRHWWKLLLTAIAPTSGFIIGILYITAKRLNGEDIGIGDKALAAVLIAASFILAFSHWDPFGADRYLRVFLDEILSD